MRPPKPVAWLLSAYRADSHAGWADWLTDAIDFVEWYRLELPGRHFAWRIRGNPLSWLDELPAAAPALIVATSMVDLATLKGLHPRLAGVPALYYFHENQFAYPRSARQHSSADAQMVQLYGALSADLILFNSVFNRDSFLQGVDGLLARMPDRVPDAVAARLLEKSAICPVPLTVRMVAAERNPRLLMWNHRWEYDKDPALFTDALCQLAGRGVDFQLALLGRRPPRPDAQLARLRACLGGRVLVDGHVESATYWRYLSAAGIVISTARHEFQGLSVMESTAAGAVPLVPDALCYPEIYPPTYRYPAGDCEALVARLGDWLSHGAPPVPDVSPWQPACLLPKWRDFLNRLITAPGRFTRPEKTY